MSTPHSPMNFQRLQTWFGVLILFAAAALVYNPAINGRFLWDDDAYVADNGALRSRDGLQAIWLQPTALPQYYPIVFTSFWLEFHLWGLQTPGYHAVNIFLHALNACMLWRILARLQVPCAWLAAAIFALHPVEVESVAWITERKNLLSGFFYLASLTAYLRFDPLDRPAPSARGRWYALSLLLFLCALLSKTVTCSLPAVIVLLIWWKRGRVTRQNWLALIPFFALGLALGIATAWIETHHVGAQGAEWTMTRLERLLVAGRALWFYAWKLAWPLNLVFIYPRWNVDPADFWQYAFPAAALALLVILWFQRQRIGRAPLVAALVFAGTLVPALGFFDVYPMRYSYVADHFQYLASAALFALAAAIAGRWPRALRWPVACGILISLGFLSWNRSHVYEDLPTLWGDTLARNPDCWMAHNNLGIYYLGQGDGPRAAEHFTAVRRQHPDLWKTTYNLGMALALQSKSTEARKCFEEAARLNPGFPGPHNELGKLDLLDKNLAAAEKEFRQAIQADADGTCWQAHYNLSFVLRSHQQWNEARIELEDVVRIAPGYAPAYHELGELSLRLGQPARALALLQRAVALDPGDAKYRQALARAAQSSKASSPHAVP